MRIKKGTSYQITVGPFTAVGTVGGEARIYTDRPGGLLIKGSEDYKAKFLSAANDLEDALEHINNDEDAWCWWENVEAKRDD